MPGLVQMQRCKKCEPCRREPCTTCGNCVDGSRLSGPNTRRKACMQKRCLTLLKSLQMTLPTTTEQATVQNIPASIPAFVNPEPHSFEQTGFILLNTCNEETDVKPNIMETSGNPLENREETTIVTMDGYLGKVDNDTELFARNSSALLQEDEESEDFKSDIEMKKEDIISSFIVIFEDANMDEKITMIYRLLEAPSIEVQEKVFPHIYQIIQKIGLTIFKQPEVLEHQQLFPKDKPECYIYGATVLNKDDLALRITNTHGNLMSVKDELKNPRKSNDLPKLHYIINTNNEPKFDGNVIKVEGEMTEDYSQEKLSEDILVKKINQVCHICDKVIAGAGTGWRFPLLTHLARKHFEHELVRDFRTKDNKCCLCRKGLKSHRRFLIHIGAKHKMAEKYLETKQLEKYKSVTSNTSIKNKSSDAPAIEVKPLQSRPDRKVTSGNISCQFCDKMTTRNSILQSHMSSRHFKQDCEEAIKQILQQTGNICPKCPNIKFSGTLNWITFVHFSRKHRMTENLEYSRNILNMDNVKKIVQTLCPKIKEENPDTNDLKKYEILGLDFFPFLTATKEEVERVKIEPGLAVQDPSDDATSYEVRPLPVKRRTVRKQPEANISCPFCEKKVKLRQVLRSHLFNNHFKNDCEEAIKQILEQTGDLCPKCPDMHFNRPLDWKSYLHFSRTHRVAENLEYSQNILNMENVQSS